MVVSPGAAAVTSFTPFATVGVDYNTNLFAVPSYLPPFAASGNTALGTAIEHYLIGATASFEWERDELRLSAQGERFEYNRFSEINHYESKLDALFNWHLGPVVDGSLEYAQSRAMAPFADTLATQLELFTDKSATGTARILITPEWRLDLQPKWHEADTPLPDYPDFGLRETSAAVSLNYLGINRLAAGAMVQYTDGSYHDIVAATRYHQISELLTANYAVTGLSSFNGQLGLTQRDSSYVNPSEATGAAANVAGLAVGSTSAFTGSLGFHRELSVKTSVDLHVFREIDSYVAGANSEIATGGALHVKWDPDVKVSVSLTYTYANDAIRGNLVTTGFVNRTDRPMSGVMDLTWKARPWLSVRPYVEWDKRSSNYELANYTATIYGIEFTARWL
jgi:hypothetical protein